MKKIITATSLILYFLFSMLSIADPTSSNYRLRTQTFDAGGNTISSLNHIISGSFFTIGSGTSSSTNYIVNGGFHVVPDDDNDTYINIIDNCINVANPGQFNGNAGTGPGTDIFGNLCDADLTNDGFTNFADLAAFRSAFGSSDAQADLNNSGFINFADLAIFRILFGTQPGESGLPTP